MLRFTTLLSVALAGCNEQSFNKVTPGNGGDGPQIEVSPTFLDFGTLGADDDAVTRTFTISSVGASTLTVDGVTIKDELMGFTLLTDSFPKALEPGESMDVEVVFAPMASDASTSALVFSDDEDDPEVPVDLKALGLVPQLMIDPDPLDFGETYVGCDKNNSVDLVNVGTSTLTIDSLGFAGDGFAMLSTVALPIALEPDESYRLYLGFEPTIEGDFSSALTVNSNEPLGTRIGTQTGTGAYGAEYTDVWEIPADPPTDIMFIVDQSCSMDDDARSLASNFSTFITSLNTFSTDWQIIVANNDQGCNTTGILTPSTSGYEATFTDAVQKGSGTYIDTTEALLIPASNGVDRTDPGECNDGFMREDALLHIVLVSDEPEQSGPWGASSDWSKYVDKIVAKKGSTALTKISAVAGPVPGGCSSGSNSADPGTGYDEAVGATGGVFLSICSSWGSNVEALAEASINQDTFELSHSPLVETIVVTVNGSERVDGWSYEATSNAIVFDEKIPREGDVVQVDYAGKVSCD